MSGSWPCPSRPIRTDTTTTRRRSCRRLPSRHRSPVLNGAATRSEPTPVTMNPAGSTPSAGSRMGPSHHPAPGRGHSTRLESTARQAADVSRKWREHRREPGSWPPTRASRAPRHERGPERRGIRDVQGLVSGLCVDERGRGGAVDAAPPTSRRGLLPAAEDAPGHEQQDDGDDLAAEDDLVDVDGRLPAHLAALDDVNTRATPSARNRRPSPSRSRCRPAPRPLPFRPPTPRVTRPPG